ncbi:phenylacetate--CoA ligase family protein [Desulfobacula phenolica]|uniref:Phenylacetate-coenzyme A ligase n=1 Tax=Desulfobacula phenolica TaxID=90732 RepID=A0A1H2DQ16_9BACT|nr:phenylacetate--CoA ligase [Desulfobacula phenolica]SDT84980.1 phenylacetate-CoA ligase [Desulfobacula phenolica]
MSFIPSDMNEEKINKTQCQGLKWTLNHVYENSLFYRKKLQDSGFEPGDITSLDDLENLPFTDKQDFLEDYPFPLRSAPMEDIVRIHGSSGTTGKRKILCYTARDIDNWANLFARCYELAGLTKQDRVQIGVGYGLWTAGAGFQNGCERLGAMAVPLGPANVEMHIDMLLDLQTTVFCSTASMALLLAEEIEKRNLASKINLKTIILGAERHSLSMRNRIQQITGAKHIHDIYGMTELYGPGTGLDCASHNGIHFWADYFIFEIIDPVTLKPLPVGEEGELVVTTLKKEGSPLIRYRTHDVTRLIPEKCDCGNCFPKHDRISGRTDDMFIFRAVNIYPSQIDDILNKIEDAGSEYQIHLAQNEDGRDYMTIRVEKNADGVKGDDSDSGFADMISREIRKKLLVRSHVELVDYGSLPRTHGKSVRVFDKRV